MSKTVRAGLLACVAPQRASDACRAGGQLLTTPSGSPLTGIICRPSGLGVLGSGCGTASGEDDYIGVQNLMPHQKSNLIQEINKYYYVK